MAFFASGNPLTNKSSVNWSPVEFRVAELPKTAFHWASANERSEWAVRQNMYCFEEYVR